MSVEEIDERVSIVDEGAVSPERRARWDEVAQGLASAATLALKERRLSRSLLDLEKNPPPPVRWTIEGLVPERSLCLLFGKPFGGKSLFALQATLHAAAGITFLPKPGEQHRGFPMPRPLRVLYVDEEMGLSLLCRRIELMKAGRSEFRDPCVLERVRVTSRAGLRLDDDEKLAMLRDELDRFPGGPPDICFLDTLRRMHLAPEKDSEEVAKITARLVEMAEFYGTSFVPIHHSKKGPQDDGEDWREAARGSGDLVAASQAVIAVWKAGDCLFSARADAKAAGEIEPFPLVLDEHTLLYRRQSDDEREASADANRETALKEAMAGLCKSLQKLKDRTGEYPASWTTWRGKTRGNTGTLSLARLALQRDGVVAEAKRDGKGGGKVYSFAADAETRSGTRSEEVEEN